VFLVTEEARDHPRFVTVSGRRLCFAEWGPPDAPPVVYLHGTPGSRLNVHSSGAAYADEVGAHVVTYDRPGYGRSDRRPGRSVVDCVADVEALVDHLGIGRFAVSGASGGGPPSLAVAARLGDRVVRARCDVGVAPYDQPDLDWFAGMDPLNVQEFGWALDSEERLAAELSRELAEMGRRVEQDPSQSISSDWDLDPTDRQVLALPQVMAAARVSTADLLAGGVWGWVDDDLSYVRPWGFDVAEIAVPVQVTYGLRDVLSPAAHGAWLAAHVPGADVVVTEGTGHQRAPESVAAGLRWLVEGT
jgi:pimeloyl-ACP methyl ester carboxylesterase